jgi:8-oxo-dGTP pyrophosphatase MutT (NUDIX family)
VKPWRRIESRRAHDCRVFDLDEVRFDPPDERPADWFYVLDAPSWINVIPLTDDDQVLFIRQFRFGTEEITLEIPGGMCDGNEPPVEAALRELREETGYDAGDIAELGWVHPNPAIQNNRCYIYLARGLAKAGPPQPDAHESFELVTIPLARIPELIAGGEITHALVITAFHLLGQRTQKGDIPL